MSDFDFTTPVNANGEVRQQRRRGPAPKQPVPPSLQNELKELENDPEVKEEVNEIEKEEEKYTKEELLQVFDSMIFSGEYSEQVVIKNRLRVRFKTRSVQDIDRISATIDATQAKLVATIQEKQSILTLQYALVEYQGVNLANDSMEQRAKFIGKLPGPIVGALLTALNEFDDKVYQACKDLEEDF
jgi:rRNA maturation endonuclease Nob1